MESKKRKSYFDELGFKATIDKLVNHGGKTSTQVWSVKIRC